MNKVSKLVSISVATALGAVLLSGTDAASADTVPNSSPTQYVIKSGDTLNTIANNYATKAQDIAESNGIKDVNVIFAGDTITINGQAPVKDTLPVAPSTPVQAPVVPVAPTKAPVAQVAPVAPKVEPVASQALSTGSVHDQFISAGGTEAMWSVIVMPESGGNPDITSPNGYHGLGQTKQAWGYGSVAEQTQGMLQYAQERYGSIENSISFRESHNWW